MLAVERWPRVVGTVAALAACAPDARAQSEPAAAAPAGPTRGPPRYRPQRADEDHRYLRDPSRRVDPWDPLKYLPLDRDGWASVSLGGEVRQRVEYFRHLGWGSGPPESTSWLQRYMVHADIRAGAGRGFVQLKSGLESGRAGGPRGVDRDRFDVHQAFLDAPLGDAPGLTLRLGRQEMAFGSSRLVSTREGPNVRQSFDGLRLMLRHRGIDAQFLVTRYVETRPGTLDDRVFDGPTLLGTHVTAPSPLSGGKVDLYSLWLSRRDAEYARGSGRERRLSLGTRWSGGLGPVEYDYEAVLQGGSLDGAPIRAWTVATDTAVRLALAWRPRLGVRLDAASGDRRSSRALGSFNALFPRGSYFGEDALIGPRNFYDAHPSVEVKPAEWLKVTVDWDVFWRQSTSDGLYNVPGDLVVDAPASRRRFLGHHPSVSLEAEASSHTTVVLYASRFVPGAFLRDSGRARTVDFVTTWITYKF